jgi:hypothetical protein
MHPTDELVGQHARNQLAMFLRQTREEQVHCVLVAQEVGTRVDVPDPTSHVVRTDLALAASAVIHKTVDQLAVLAILRVVGRPPMMAEGP